MDPKILVRFLLDSFTVFEASDILNMKLKLKHQTQFP